MPILEVVRPFKSFDTRIKFLISFTSNITVALSLIYLLLLVYTMLIGSATEQMTLGFTVIIVALFIYAKYLNNKDYTQPALFIIITTIVAVCFSSGIKWGFDMPSVLLGYIMVCTLSSVATSKSTAMKYLLISVLSIFVGHYARIYGQIYTTWHSLPVTIDDLVEFSVVLCYIMTLLFFSNREQYKLLNRSIRGETLLQAERNQLQETLNQKISEIKKLQLDKMSQVYHFVEFGRMTSGLLHDFTSPIQTLKLQVEAVDDSFFEIDKIKKTAYRLESMMKSLRRHISFDEHIDLIDPISEIKDIVDINKYIQIKNNISVLIDTDSESCLFKTKRSIFNHAIQNLISNACEACTGVTDRDRIISIYVRQQQGKIFISITDTGVGIPTDKINKIFEPFYSTKNTNGDVNNCGIGLSSVKHLVEKQLNGQILCQSTVNQGTTMTLIL